MSKRHKPKSLSLKIIALRGGGSGTEGTLAYRLTRGLHEEETRNLVCIYYIFQFFSNLLTLFVFGGAGPTYWKATSAPKNIIGKVQTLVPCYLCSYSSPA